MSLIMMKWKTKVVEHYYFVPTNTKYPKKRRSTRMSKLNILRNRDLPECQYLNSLPYLPSLPIFLLAVLSFFLTIFKLLHRKKHEISNGYFDSY